MKILQGPNQMLILVLAAATVASGTAAGLGTEHFWHSGLRKGCGKGWNWRAYGDQKKRKRNQSGNKRFTQHRAFVNGDVVLMQSLFELLHDATGGKLSFTIGLVLAAGLLLQLLIEIVRGLLRLISDRRQQRLALERLRLQIQETRVRSQETEQTKLLWNGNRKFTVAKKSIECRDVCAFYLKPH